MRNTKKIVSYVLALTMIVCSLSACGKKKPKYITKTELIEETVDNKDDNEVQNNSESNDLEFDDYNSKVEFDDFNIESDEDEPELDLDDLDIEEVSEKEKTLTAFSNTKFGKYKYVWGDEFNEKKLDTKKFQVMTHSGESTDIELFNWGDKDLNKVFNIGGGAANMSFIRWYNPTNSLLQFATCGGLNTKNTMSYKYGYLEIRTNMTFNKDKNSIWLVSKDALNAPQSTYCNLEIDVFETLASFDSVTPNIHKWYADGRHTDFNGLKGPKPYTFFDTYNLSKEYHLYGFLWTPTEISMYVDDEKYWTLDTTKSFDSDDDTTAFNLPMYLMLNVGGFTEGGTWHAYSGDEVDLSALPYQVKVDWVRLYQDPSIAGNQLNTK